jgi:hypothetical protein
MIDSDSESYIFRHNRKPRIYSEEENTILEKRIIGLLRFNNSTFDLIDQMNTTIKSGVLSSSSMEKIGLSGSTDSSESVDSKYSETEIDNSVCFSDSSLTGSTESSDYSDTERKKIIEHSSSRYWTYNKTTSTYKPKKFIKSKKKSLSEMEKKDCYKYDSAIVSEFNKDSPFINMLINKRISSYDNGPSCHIAAFVQNLSIENKFRDWAFGKFAIGENSERMRFGNVRLSTHAEMDALKKLTGLIRVQKCKKQKMDLVVIRINKSGNLCESAPCYHCTKELEKNKIVTINKLYFSRSDGTITCIKFSEWIKNDHQHISKGWKWLSCYQK